MTTEEAVQRVVNLAKAEVGYHEGANNYNKYAADPMITQLYGWSLQNQPWCCLFVNWLFLTAFGFYQGKSMTYGGSPGCAVQASFYQKNGAYYPAYNAQVGDQIFFIRNGGINHTGIVVEVDGSTINTIEGNASDSVAERTYSIGDSQISGVGRPLWAVVADDTPSVPEVPDTPDTPREDVPRGYVTLKHGDGIKAPMATVRAWQTILQAWGFNLGKAGADGEFGALTLTATEKLQAIAGIEEDGIVGEETWKQGIIFPQ